MRTNTKKSIEFPITIALPVFNEGGNIKQILKSILKQKESTFTIKEILILSDGSTDNTIREAKKIKDKRIKIHADTQRKGKSLRLNEIFRMSKSKYIVLLDADVILTQTNTLQKLLQPFHDTSHVGLVSGKALPFEAETFIEKSVNISIAAYLEMVNKIHDGNNIFAVEGRILAIKKLVGLGIPLPANGIATDAFLYLSTLKQKYTFQYVEDAVVGFASPRSMKEHIHQNKRFVARKYTLKRYFGSRVERELVIPPSIFIPTMVKYLCINPVYSFSIFFINAYSKFLAKKDSNSIGSLWPMATSTKRQLTVS